MKLFHHNRPKHSLLLMPVRLGKERLPRQKVRILSCDAEGNLFTQLIGKTVYNRIYKEAQLMEMSQNNYATVYWDTRESSPEPIIVKIGTTEAWALERILDHALNSALIPDVLKMYPKEIIELGEVKHQELLLGKTRETRKATPETSSRVLNRLPYYRNQDMEVSIPIYKARYAFPLIILKRLPPDTATLPGQQRMLVLDNAGDLAVTILPFKQTEKAERKLNNLQKQGKEGRLICLRKDDGIYVDVMEISGLQKQALETMTQYFDETGKSKRSIPITIKKVLDKARGIAAE